MKIYRYSPLLLSLITVASATSSVSVAEEISPIIVTATRTAQTVDKTLASATIISRDDIDASMATTLPELLSGYPGIDFSNAGGIGKDTQLSIRGTNKDHSIILVDGIQVGSATTGEPNIQHIPLEQIERIEIVRGVRSSLYGSAAIGGVIHIFTRKGSDKPTAHASIEVGSANHQKVTAGYADKLGNTRYQFSANHFTTDGIHAREVKNPDLDGYINNSLSLSTQSQLGSDSQLDISVMQSWGRNWYDGFSSSSDYYTDFKQQTLGVHFNHTISDTWISSLTVGQHGALIDDFKDDTLSGSYETQRQTASWQNDFVLSDSNLLTVGLDKKFEDIESQSTASFPVKTRNVTGIFAEEQLNTQAMDINISARHDAYSDFGQHMTGSVVLGKDLGSMWNGFMSLGTAFKAPTMNQLYSSVGNASLLAEEATSSELGVKYRSGSRGLEFSLYQTDISNLIAYDSGTGKYQQTDQARIRGVEANYMQQLGRWRTNITASLTDPRDVATGNVLRRRAQETYKLDFRRKFATASVNLNMLYQGRRFDDHNNTTRLDAYTLVNLRGDYPLSNGVKLMLKIDNLFNEQYEIRSGYNTLGTSYYLGLDYKM